MFVDYTGCQMTVDPMKSSYYALSGVASRLVRTGEVLGLSRRALLSAAQLEESALVDRDARVPLSCIITLARYMQTERPEVNFSLVNSQAMNPHDLGVISYALQHSATLDEAFGLFVRYQRLLTNAATWCFDRARGQVTLDAIDEFAALRFSIEGQLGLWVRLARQLTGEDCRPTRVRFRHALILERSDNESFFGVAIEYGADVNALDFDLNTLALPVLSARPALLPSILALTDGYLPQQDCSVKERLLTTLRAAFSKGNVDRDSVARKLGMSQRTLSRKLRSEGTTYGAVVNEAREVLAKAWLRNPEVAIHEVVFMLGYSEPSTFYRAFRRWTGHTPAAWRAAQLAID